jgi:hypothetical protein
MAVRAYPEQIIGVEKGGFTVRENSNSEVKYYYIPCNHQVDPNLLLVGLVLIGAIALVCVVALVKK